MQGDFRVGDRLVSPKLNRLVRDGQEIRIEPKAMQVLVYLADRPNELASREELIGQVWRETFVTDDVLKRCISDLRKALGDNRENPQFIETIPKGGYRLIAPVSALAVDASTSSETTRRLRFSPAGLLGVALVLIAGAIVVGQYLLPGRLGVRRGSGVGVTPAAGRALDVPVHPELRVFPLTTLPGWESGTLSPDGTHLAFIWNAEDPYAENLGHLYVTAIGAASPRRVTKSLQYEYSPAWSPDGRFIAFLRDAGPSSVLQDIVIVPATGGSERVVGGLRSWWRGLDWSPDERFLAINDSRGAGGQEALYLFSLEDGQRRQMVAPPQGYDGDTSPRFSPDGRSLAFVRQRVFPYTADVHVLDLSSGESTQITFDNEVVAGVDWLPDGRDLIFSSARILGGGHLWTVAATGGTPKRIAITARSVGRPSIARRGPLRMAYTDLQTDPSLWRVAGPTGDPKAAPLRVDQSTWADMYPSYSPDGQKIACISYRSGYAELWVSDSNAGNPRQVTFLKRPIMKGFAWSPDGQRMAFTTVVDRYMNIHVVPVNGGFPVRITRDPIDQLYPSFSHDGKYIYFSGGAEIWKTPTSGGQSVQVTHRGGVEARESSDGRYLYYTKGRPLGTPGIWRVRLPDGEEERIAEGGTTGRWALFDRGLCYIDFDSESRPRFLCLDDEQATPRQLPIPETKAFLAGLAVSPDGRWILYGRRDSPGTDIVAAEGFWRQP